MFSVLPPRYTLPTYSLWSVLVTKVPMNRESSESVLGTWIQVEVATESEASPFGVPCHHNKQTLEERKILSAMRNVLFIF